MPKGRRCYCDRLYPGFRCAYCRIDDIVAEQERIDPIEQARRDRAKAQSQNWWTRLSAYGRSVLGSRRSAR